MRIIILLLLLYGCQSRAKVQYEVKKLMVDGGHTAYKKDSIYKYNTLISKYKDSIVIGKSVYRIDSFVLLHGDDHDIEYYCQKDGKFAAIYICYPCEELPPIRLPVDMQTNSEIWLQFDGVIYYYSANKVKPNEVVH